jgi:hypothetical protein
MRELFETAIAPIKIGEPGVTAARRAIVNLGYNPDPKFRATADNLKAQRKGLWYQNWNPGNYEGKLKHVEGDFKQTGDFLHFGINTSEPDELSSPVRVYVSPKPWAVGKVAAELIRKSREQGYEPYGKAWDESSVSGRLNNRRDRILIVPRTENQLRIVMDGLRDIQATKPELFEPETVLLAEKSDMHGIGLAEEPRQDGGPKKSFNGSREVLIESAWRETLTDLVGKETDYEGQSTQLDRLRAAVQSGKKSMKEIVASFRVHAKKQSLEHGISPDNIARNLQ